MYFKCRLYVIFAIFSVVSIDFGYSSIRRYNRYHNYLKEDSSSDTVSNPETGHKQRQNLKFCWLRINSKKHFEAMDKLDDQYAEVRQEYQDAAIKDNFDEQMLDAMLKTRGTAQREIQKVAGDTGLIPAGINLGGYFMMRMPNSLLFFHRMKLRNNTYFRITDLHNDLVNLTLNAQLSLNDLHLVGSYDRSVTDKDPSILFYTPTYGQVEILLKNVHYRLEGRYRLLKDRLTIELVISEIDIDDIMMTYLNNTNNESMRLQRKNIDDFLLRLKSDLNKWLKDYFNDYLMYFGLIGKSSNDKFQQYDKEKAVVLNEYTDHVIGMIIRRIHEINAESITLPKFTIFSANNMEIILKDGVLRGLDSMYRRSIATGKKEANIRKVDAVVGFSNLKVTYHYEAVLDSKTPVLNGMLILCADELTTRMELVVATNSDSSDIQFEFLEQAKPESLTIEGPANRVISNFKYLLEQHIIAIMSNTLLYNIKMLGSLTRCVPLLHGHEESNVNFEKNITNSDKKYEDIQSSLEDQKTITIKNSELEEPVPSSTLNTEFDTTPKTATESEETSGNGSKSDDRETIVEITQPVP